MAKKYIQKNNEGLWTISNSEEGKALRICNTQKEAILIAGTYKSTDGILIKRSGIWQPATGWDKSLLESTKSATTKKIEKKEALKENTGEIKLAKKTTPKAKDTTAKVTKVTAKKKVTATKSEDLSPEITQSSLPIIKSNKSNLDHETSKNDDQDFLPPKSEAKIETFSPSHKIIEHSKNLESDESLDNLKNLHLNNDSTTKKTVVRVSKKIKPTAVESPTPQVDVKENTSTKSIDEEKSTLPLEGSKTLEITVETKRSDHIALVEKAESSVIKKDVVNPENGKTAEENVDDEKNHGLPKEAVVNVSAVAIATADPASEPLKDNVKATSTIEIEQLKSRSQEIKIDDQVLSDEEITDVLENDLPQLANKPLPKGKIPGVVGFVISLLAIVLLIVAAFLIGYLV